MTMRDEQPAIWSASAGASFVAPNPPRDVGGEQMFEERTLNLPASPVFWE